MLNPRELISAVKKLEIKTRKNVDELTGGAYHSVFKGRGMEFCDVREYSPGDDVRTIDWNVTARTNKLHVKEFVEERDLRVYVIFDCTYLQRLACLLLEHHTLRADALRLQNGTPGHVSAR